MSALEMLVAQDAAADDGQVRVAADKIVRESRHEVEQLFKGLPADHHRRMLSVQDDAVLVVIDIGAVLHEPLAAADGHGNQAVVLAGRMVHPACVALVFGAEQALGVAGLRGVPRRRDGLGVLFRLAQVDGDHQVAVFGRRGPAHVLFDAVAADIIGILGKAVIPVRRLPGRKGVQLGKALSHLVGPGRQDAHELCIQQVPAGHVPGADAAGNGVVQQAL